MCPNEPQDPKKYTFVMPTAALIVEDDTAVRLAMIKATEKFGVPIVRAAVDFRMAWESIEMESFELIVIDWKLRGKEGGGVKLFNRLRRSKKFQNIPIVVMSGFLDDKDFRLLDDFPVVRKLQKPCEFDEISKKYAEVLIERDWLAKKRKEIAAAFSTAKREPSELLSLMREFLRDAPNPQPFVSTAASYLISHAYVAEAEQLLQGILQKNPNSIVAMTELGKICIGRKRYPDAIKYLQKAQELSPNSMERICLLGNLKLESSDASNAENLFDAALAIDAEDSDARSGKEISKNINQFVSGESKKVVPSSYAGLLNAVGVSLVNMNQFQKGIEHYQNALKRVHQPDTKARLAFNMGLGYNRWNKPDDALIWFQKAMEFAGGKYDKAKRQHDRILEIKAKEKADREAAEKAAEEKKKKDAEEAKAATVKMVGGKSGDTGKTADAGKPDVKKKAS